MRLVRLAVRNFRCYRDWTAVDFADLTALVGRNESGKSTLLDVLQVFFDDAIPDQDDLNIEAEDDLISISCFFDNLPEALILDAEYPTNLEDEYLLNEEGLLEIHKVYNCKFKKPQIEDVYANCLHPSTGGASDLLQLKNVELKQRVDDIGISLDGVDARVNTQLRQAIWSSFPDLSLETQLVPLAEETAKKIWDMLKLKLPVYALFKSDRSSTDQDAEAQDPMKAAIKEAIKAKEAELDVIADHVKQQVENIAARTVEKLREMDSDLAAELKPRFTTSPWANVFRVSLTDDEEIPINKRGSGVRRLILLNFFRAKAEQTATDREAPSLIYAVEEPETSQHPDNQRMLVRAFGELATQPDCQVLLTTHVPALARLLNLESLRYLEVLPDGTRIIHAGDNETFDCISRTLGVLPDTNVRLFIGVEGPNDINFLTSISTSLRSAGEDIPDLVSYERDGHIVFIPLGGGNLAHWTSRLAGLNIPEFYLFDRDIEPPSESPHQDIADEMNERDNCTAVISSKRETENYLHSEAILLARNITVEVNDFNDVPALVAQTLHEESESPIPWAEVDTEGRKKKESRAKLWLNVEAAGRITPDMLDDRDPDGEVRGWFKIISDYLATSM